jgi:hypothetical protein
MRNFQLLVVTILIVAISSGCAVIATPAATPTFPPTQRPTDMLPSPTALPPTQTLPSVTPTATMITLPTPITIMTAVTGVDNLVLRSGPGTLFDSLGIYKENVTVSVLGRSQGNGWYFVVTPINLAGWMKSELLTLQGDPADLPYFAYTEAIVITGHVRTDSGVFASGIGVSISPVGKDLGAGPDTTITDSNGVFYLYIPKDLTGEYQVGPNSYTDTSNLIVGKGDFPYQLSPAIQVTLPPDPAITFEFVLKHN